MSELVSVVVPIYNMARYLPRCVDSVLEQSYKNLQIILVNDGSTDESLVICEEYARRDSRVEIINKKNGGLSDARNAGILSAKGEYIAFVDSDDYVHHQYIENMYLCIKRDNSDICICDLHSVNEGEEDLADISRKPALSDYPAEGLYSAEAAMIAIYNTKYYHVIACNKLYRRKLFDDIKYPIGRLHEDEFVLHRLFSSCNLVSIHPERLYYYVRRLASTTGKPYSADRLDALDAFDDRMCFYLEKKTYSLLKGTCLGYIRRYVDLYRGLPMNVKENALRWNECTVKFRTHGKTMFVHGGFVIGLRFLLAASCPKAYNMFSDFLNYVRNRRNS